MILHITVLLNPRNHQFSHLIFSLLQVAIISDNIISEGRDG